MNQTLFHPGELAAQALAGVVTPNAGIRDWMPDQHRTFFGLLRFLPIATAGPDSAPVATILTGPAGFITSPDSTTLRIAAHPARDDPTAPFLVAGAPVGVLGIDLATRRRNRANGVLRSVGPDGVTISVRQSFGNCPQYIQTRMWHDAEAACGPVEQLSGLDAAARVLVAGADTFFVATTSGAGAMATGAGGVDISHRGGRPGFIRVTGDTLTIPDFHGNRYFNTFGNLLLDPRAALLFVDWNDGTLLHLQGTAEILRNETGDFNGAERLWRLSVGGGWRRQGRCRCAGRFRSLRPRRFGPACGRRIKRCRSHRVWVAGPAARPSSPPTGAVR
jgi:predicted pyridoxine 5'-phosphate oxidase superfamily flavin-nucleotide-binding protein